MERREYEIDKISIFNSFRDASVTQIIVFVHGIFGSSTETWHDTPAKLMTSPQFSKFDYASYGYTSQIIQWRQPEVFVQQFALWMRTHLRDYQEIFLVCHSMGGLLARHAITDMLSEPQAENHRLVGRIRRCFMVAAPVTGSWAAKFISWVPFLARLNTRIAYLASPKINGLDMSVAYAMAARSFIESGGNKFDVPRFNYFTGVQDKIVAAPERLFFTEYDSYEGPVSGTHSSLKLDLNANSTLLTRIGQLIQDSSLRSEFSQRVRIELIKESTRKREQATQDSAHGAVAESDDQRRPIDVVLISCSATKSDAPGTLHSKSNWIMDQVDDPRLGDIILEMRSRMLRLVQAGRVDGIEFKEGNRATKPANRQLIFGPDFGGVFNEERYLPAYLRYTGRCYQAARAEWEALLRQPDHPQVLIMSGLYGLIPATEPIQNYDMHLTDVDLDSSISMQSYWKDRELMTQLLIANLEWIQTHRGPVGRVVDALSELSYQETVNWSLIDRRWDVVHRVFESRAGRNALGNLGFWLRDVIRNPALIRNLDVDRFYQNPSFYPADRIAFERHIGGSNLAVAREIVQ